MSTQSAKPRIAVLGAGLAGSEAALQLAAAGHAVDLFEMRPERMTEAHKTHLPAELVCSNSFKSLDPTSAPGMLKTELELLNSFVLRAGKIAQIPGGQALTIDRDVFAAQIDQWIKEASNITKINKEVTDLQSLTHDAVLLATGPLTSPSLTSALETLTGAKDLYFYDAIAPIVTAESVDWNHAFLANRYHKGGEDVYINCPLDEGEYREFLASLLAGTQVPPKNFEKEILFQGCQPIERIAATGPETLRFGPMKPVGLVDPKTGKRPYAVVQLRPEHLNKSAYNLVGFQTKLTYKAQPEIFRKIPALKNAQFIRYGSIHRNTYLNSPDVLSKDLSFKRDARFFAAGQIIGVEGYLESASLGLLAAHSILARLQGESFLPPPRTSVLGGLYQHVTTPTAQGFQPMNACFAILSADDFPGLHAKIKSKDERRSIMADQGLSDIHLYQKKLIPSEPLPHYPVSI